VAYSKIGFVIRLAADSIPLQPSMRILITCGPSYEPIDGARRITNFSTGKLGITLANAFTDQGWEVHCFKGEQATCPDPLRCHATQSFSTNEDLADRLEKLSRTTRFDAVLHAAALCDFKVERVEREDGQAVKSPKFSTREGQLLLVLAPAMKLLQKLPGWFPQARIVGWKYELAGTQAGAFDQAWDQLRDSHTGACVLNGAAYGSGFAVCLSGGAVTKCADAAELIEFFLRWLDEGR
jgi:phosphopantothenoylcysteine decarboxylase/phosphopantothenate--cysteine ligase